MGSDSVMIYLGAQLIKIFLADEGTKVFQEFLADLKRRKIVLGKVGWETGVNSKLFILFFKLISYYRVKLVQTLHASISNLIVVIFHKFA